jgi:hypothetical protein
MSGTSPVAAEEVLDAEQQRIEGLQLALRTSGGVPASSLPPLDDLVAVHGDQAVLTVRGRLLASEVATRLR